MGGVNVADKTIPYVARLVFDPYNWNRDEIDLNLFTQCSGIIIHANYILTTKLGINFILGLWYLTDLNTGNKNQSLLTRWIQIKFCCNADDKVTIYLNEYKGNFQYNFDKSSKLLVEKTDLKLGFQGEAQETAKNLQNQVCAFQVLRFLIHEIH